jgi:uroporphyrinogen-III synthase
MNAFITRALSGASEFKKRLADAGWHAEGQSLVELSPSPFSEIPAADWVFFSSKNAVRFFFQPLKSGGGFELPPDLEMAKWAALGPATAKALAEFVEQVDFVGTGEPKSTAAAFRRVNPTPDPSPERRGDVEGSVEDTMEVIAADSTSPLPSGEGAGVGLRILFPAARHSRQSVMSFLASDFQCVHFPIYDNRPVAEPPRSEADVLVFTSPMNAQAYFSKNKLGEKQRVVAIGETTAEALRELGISKIEIADEPSERGLAEAVLRLRG